MASCEPSGDQSRASSIGTPGRELADARPVGVGNHQDQPAVGLTAVGRSPAEEREPRPVAGEHRAEVERRAGDQGRAAVRERVDQVDVAVGTRHELAVAGRPERRRNPWLAGSDGQDGEPNDREDQENDEQGPAEPGRRERARAGGQIHGEPPFEARPGRALAARARRPQDRIEMVGHAMCAELVQPVGDDAAGIVVHGHAGRPSETCGPGRASASSTARISRRPR